MGGKFVRLIKDRQIPARRAEFLLLFLVARKLVEADYQLREIIKWIATRRGLLKQGGIHMEFQAEFLVQFIAPLLYQTSRRYDENSMRVRAHTQLADVESGHYGFARAGVVRERADQPAARLIASARSVRSHEKPPSASGLRPK